MVKIYNTTAYALESMRVIIVFCFGTAAFIDSGDCKDDATLGSMGLLFVPLKI